MLTAVQACLWALALLALPAAVASDPYAAGNAHYFNREFDEAVHAFRQLVEREPENPSSHFLLAKGLLYQELNRLGMVGSSAFGHDEEYNDFEKPKPDPGISARIRGTLDLAADLCTRRLETHPTDRDAMYTHARVLALRATFEFMVGKAYFKALANGRRARALSYRVAELHPEFVDGLLVAGLDEYILGSLPWAVRALIALSGYRGRRRKGAEMIARVASDGTVSRNEARVLFALVQRRERRYAEAAASFRSLAEDFPRAYTFMLESAAMEVAAGNRKEALAVFREVERRRAADEHRYGRMPERVTAALGRRIADLEEEFGSD